MSLQNSIDPKITNYTPIAITSRINGLYVLVTNVLGRLSHTLVFKMILLSEINSDILVLSIKTNHFRIIYYL